MESFDFLNFQSVDDLVAWPSGDAIQFLQRSLKNTHPRIFGSDEVCIHIETVF
ncbi:MAG: hypothetical protein ACFFE2_06675 [Candidatus Thorarchaeota archaeon]